MFEYEVIPPDCEADALELMAECPEYRSDPENLMIQAQQDSLLRENLRNLGQLEGLVICLHHGVYGFMPRTLEKIAEGLHRPVSAIRRAHDRAIKKLSRVPEIQVA
jgi:DNA-directed RNA polymerase sigma subunit (sigma70/sigma32)